MNRAQATELLQRYRDFPATNIFATKPFNYPLFHLLECFSKGWHIQHLEFDVSDQWIPYVCLDPNFEKVGRDHRTGNHSSWRYVARNTGLPRTMLGFVQEDLYCRYVGRCNPLKSPKTSWTFIPLEKVQDNYRFRGKIGKITNLYLIEIDLDIVDIKGEWNDDVPWHYLQQTIDWKPYTDRIDWQNDEENELPVRRNVINGPRLIMAGGQQLRIG
jgi:hypothetical protein